MTVTWIEFLVEEPSMEDALRGIMPSIRADVGFDVHVFQGLEALRKSLPDRFKGYKAWLPDDYRVVVLLDEDRQDCRTRKREIESMARSAGLKVKSSTGTFQVMVRLAVEELEAWWFGDLVAVSQAYPGVSTNLASHRRYRDPDAIRGGTCEAFERVLKQAGHFPTGLSKRLAARAIAPRIDPARNTSRSFQVFRDGLRNL